MVQKLILKLMWRLSIATTVWKKTRDSALTCRKQDSMVQAREQTDELTMRPKKTQKSTQETAN